MDANSPAQAVTPAMDSAPTAPAQASVTTPPVEHTGSVQPAVSAVPERVPYDRFREVISQKNEYADKIQALERRLSAYETNLIQNQQSSVVDEAVSKLTAAGLDANAAKLLVDTQMSLMDRRVNERLQPIEQKAVRNEVEGWINNFSQSHEDYKTLEPLMEREFAALPPQQQAMIASSPAGLEMLYWKVKGVNAAGLAQSNQAQGAQQAYNTMAQKAAMSSTPGSAAQPQGLTRDAISRMSSEEYSKRRSEIFAAIQAGQIK